LQVVAELVFRKNFSLSVPTANQLLHCVERDDSETPSLQEFCEFSAKHVINALGDKYSTGAPNNNKLRNFAFLRKFYETFNNHNAFVQTLNEVEEDEDEETVIKLMTAWPESQFAALRAASQAEPDGEYTGNVTFDEADSDKELGNESD